MKPSFMNIRFEMPASILFPFTVRVSRWGGVRDPGGANVPQKESPELIPHGIGPVLITQHQPGEPLPPFRHPVHEMQKQYAQDEASDGHQYGFSE